MGTTSRLLAAALSCAAVASAQSPAPTAQPSPPAAGLVLEDPSGRFGELYAGTEIVQAFTVRNDGAKPARVTDVFPKMGGTRTDELPGPIPPGGRATVTVRQATLGRLGVVAFRLAFRTDDGLPDRNAMLNGFLQSAYEPDQPRLLGEAAPGGQVEATLTSREVDRLDVLEVEDAPDFTTVDAKGRNADGAVIVRVTLKPDAPQGVHTGTMLLRTNAANQPLASMPYRLVVFGDVHPEDTPVDLGGIRQGQPFEKKTRLRSRSGKAIAVKSIESGGPHVKVETAPCAEPSPSCTALVFKGTGPAPSGRLGGTARVKLGDGSVLGVPYTGLLLATDAVVHDLGTLGDGQGPSPSPALKFPPPTPPPVPPPVTGKPGERVARLNWSAGQEEQAFGFLIYRADKREGPFRRVNARIVPVMEGPPPHQYTYEDREVQPGHSYFYYLESVSKAGVKARLSGVVTKVIPPAP